MRDIGGDALECISDVMFAEKQGKPRLQQSVDYFRMQRPYVPDKIF